MMNYLEWQSNLSLEQVFAQSDNVSYPAYIGDSVVFLKAIRQEGNRSALMMTGDNSNTQPRCITPAPYDLRSKINEYGGKPYWVFENEIYFVNNFDQRLYQQVFGGEEVSDPVAVSPLSDNRIFMSADLVKAQSWMLAVVETEVEAEVSNNELENTHAIQAFRLDSGDDVFVDLVSGANFYSNLCISPKRDKLAWVQWNHPGMPWDETELWVADLEVDEKQIKVTKQKRIALAEGASVCQLLIASNGRLFFSVDFSGHDAKSAENYWHIKSYDFDHDCVFDLSRKPIAESDELGEFGYPHWQYGDARIVQFDKDRLLAFGATPHGDDLYLIDQQSLLVEKVLSPFLVDKKFNSLASNGRGKASMIIRSQDSNPALVELYFDKDKSLALNTITESLMPLSLDDISVAEHLEYTTRDNDLAYGYYYPPVNANYQNGAVPDQQLTAPPLIVMVHGGPTARADGYFDLQKQFWTNRGFAIFDVNHRGSTGHGRAYRDALLGQWGIVEIDDIIDGVNYLVSQNKANPDEICIRGKSAGGYTVLRALTEYPTKFKAGACYYGIGNLATLAKVTHKFERYYTDRLIGEEYDADSASEPSSQFFQRSPINKVSNLQTAMIIFQGLKDRVVPPTVAQEMVSVLKQSDITHSYVEYTDEGHGFRQAETNIDAWSRELAFYRTVLSKVA